MGLQSWTRLEGRSLVGQCEFHAVDDCQLLCRSLDTGAAWIIDGRDDTVCELEAPEWRHHLVPLGRGQFLAIDFTNQKAARYQCGSWHGIAYPESPLARWTSSLAWSENDSAWILGCQSSSGSSGGFDWEQEVYAVYELSLGDSSWGPVRFLGKLRPGVTSFALATPGSVVLCGDGASVHLLTPAELAEVEPADSELAGPRGLSELPVLHSAELRRAIGQWPGEWLAFAEQVFDYRTKSRTTYVTSIDLRTWKVAEIFAKPGGLSRRCFRVVDGGRIAMAETSGEDERALTLDLIGDRESTTLCRGIVGTGAPVELFAFGQHYLVVLQHGGIDGPVQHDLWCTSPS